MAPGTAATLASLVEYLSSYPGIKLLTPESADFETVRTCFVSFPDRKPFAITRPQSAEDVQALVRFAVKNDVDFTYRSGGHDCAGRSQVNNALMLDLRDINYVKVDNSKTTARVGGGILLGRLTELLVEEELVTPW